MAARRAELTPEQREGLVGGLRIERALLVDQCLDLVEALPSNDPIVIAAKRLLEAHDQLHSALDHSTFDKECEPDPTEPVARITENGLSPARRLAGTDSGASPIEEEVSRCREWLHVHATPASRLNGEISSYGLKHRVEAASGDYCSNGSFIEAAHREGIRFVRVAPGSPNAYFFARFDQPAPVL